MYQHVLKNIFFIWLRPHAVLKEVLATKPTWSIFILVAIPSLTVGVIGLCLPLFAYSPAYEMQQMVALGIWTFLGTALMTMLHSFAWLYFGSCCYQWVGEQFGGHAIWSDLRVAMAWSNAPFYQLAIAPFLLAIPLWLLAPIIPTIVLLIIGSVYALGYIILVVLMSYAIVIFLQIMGQVQGFSAWRAAVVVLIVWIIYTVLTVILISFVYSPFIRLLG